MKKINVFAILVVANLLVGCTTYVTTPKTLVYHSPLLDLSTKEPSPDVNLSVVFSRTPEGLVMALAIKNESSVPIKPNPGLDTIHLRSIDEKIYEVDISIAGSGPYFYDRGVINPGMAKAFANIHIKDSSIVDLFTRGEVKDIAVKMPATNIAFLAEYSETIEPRRVKTSEAQKGINKFNAWRNIT